MRSLQARALLTVRSPSADRPSAEAGLRRAARELAPHAADAAQHPAQPRRRLRHPRGRRRPRGDGHALAPVVHLLPGLADPPAQPAGGAAGRAPAGDPARARRARPALARGRRRPRARAGLAARGRLVEVGRVARRGRGGGQGLGPRRPVVRGAPGRRALRRRRRRPAAVYGHARRTGPGGIPAGTRRDVLGPYRSVACPAVWSHGARRADADRFAHDLPRLQDSP